MTPHEAQENIKACIQELSEKVPEFIFNSSIQGGSFANDLHASIEDRLVNKGVNAFGRSFPAYNPKYAAYKEKKGKFGGFRNFSFKDDMMGNFKAFKEGNEYMIGFNNETEKKKAEWNSEMADVSNIIEPSKAEIDEQVKYFEQRIMKILNKYMA